MIFILAGGFTFAGEFLDAVRGGKVSADLRLRHENVDQDGIDKTASANTIRLRLGYTTADYNGFQFHVDVESIQKLFDENFNSTNNGKTEYPVVADPVGSELNQAYITYAGVENFLFKVGRQRIILDNARFVGNVGWRQNEQTYDAYTAVFSGVENGTFTLTNVQRINRIFGEYNANPFRANTDSNAFIAHYKHKFAAGTLSAYGHFIELQSPEQVGGSHQNLGLRFAGSKNKFLYAVEYAKQSDYKDGSDGIDSFYSLAEVGAKLGKVTLQLGSEVLGGNGTYGFSTPLATLHAFNGWADKFLSTPGAGLQDLYVAVSSKVKAGNYPVVLKAVFHDFQSSSEDDYIGFSSSDFDLDYGTELDALVKVVLSKKASVLLKYANYSADDLGTDTTKIWLMGGYSF